MYSEFTFHSAKNVFWVDSEMDDECYIYIKVKGPWTRFEINNFILIFYVEHGLLVD